MGCDDARHEADQEVTTADKANKAAKPTEPKSPHVTDRLDCSEDSWAEATSASGQLPDVA